MLAAIQPAGSSKPRAFRDGLGDRILALDPGIGGSVQVLHLDRALAAAPGFEVALRERIARFTEFRDAAYARTFRLESSPTPGGHVSLVSEHVEGLRLSDLLRLADEHGIVVEAAAALSVIRQLLPATALFHEFAPELAHGLIAPERLIITPRGKVVLTEQVLCGAIEHLRYSPQDLWRRFRAVGWPEGGRVRFTPRSDVVEIGLVALALLLGRPLSAEDVPAGVPALVKEARERSSFGDDRPLSGALRDWVVRALQLDAARSFHSPPEAWVVFEKLVSANPAYLTASTALETFMCRCTTAIIQSRSAESCLAGAGRSAQPVVQEPNVAAARPVLHLAVVTPDHQADGELQARMLPPDSTGYDEDPATGGDGIDWAAIDDAPGAIATAHEISSLFAESASEPVEPAEPLLRAESYQPAPLRADRIRLTSFDSAPEPPPVPVKEVLIESEALEGSSGSARSSHLRRIGVAAALAAALLGGGTAFVRFLRPTIVAASEMGTLVVETKPSGLQVFVDGIDRGRAPARIPVAAGDHVLEVRGQGSPRVVPVRIEGGTEVSQFVEVGVPETSQSSTEADALGATHGPAETVVNQQPRAAGPPKPQGMPASSTAEPGAEWGWLTVKTPVVAQVRLAGNVVGTTASERIRMPAGRHEIELVNESRAYRRRSAVQIVPGKVTSLNVQKPANGIVSLNATPWAEVWVGGRRLGETPLANVTLPAGNHEVIFRHPEFGEKRETINVVAGTPLRLGVDMK